MVRSGDVGGILGHGFRKDWFSKINKKKLAITSDYKSPMLKNLDKRDYTSSQENIIGDDFFTNITTITCLLEICITCLFEMCITCLLEIFMHVTTTHCVRANSMSD
jgi:hypothetical protein